MEGANFSSSSAMGGQQGAPHIPHNPTPRANSQPKPEFTLAERIVGTSAVGFSATTAGVATYEAHQNAKYKRLTLDLEIKGKIGEVRDKFNDGQYEEQDAIYQLRNLDVPDHKIAEHLKSAQKKGFDSKLDYTIVNSKMVPIETSKDGRIVHPITKNRGAINELNNTRSYCHEEVGIFKQYKKDLSKDSHLHSFVDDALKTNENVIEEIKILQLVNTSENEVDSHATYSAGKALMEKTTKAREKLVTAIGENKQGLAQHELTNIIPSGKFSSQQHQGPGKGPVGSITNAFLEKSQALFIDDNSKAINYSIAKNPVCVVSERVEGFDTRKQMIEEKIFVEKPLSSLNTFHASFILLGLSSVLWATWLYLRNERLRRDARTFQEKDSKNEGLRRDARTFQEKDSKIATLNHIIQKFKRNELSFKEANELLMNHFNFTKPVAQELLLKL